MTIEKTRTTQPTNRQQTATIKARRAALAGGVGTLIEYYDFSLYGYMAVIIAPLFFPSDRPVTSLLSALAVFGTAYLIRPLGGLVFGYIGDRYGRKKALMATLISMGAGSTMMGLLPTPAHIGVWAAVLLVARCVSYRGSPQVVKSADPRPSLPNLRRPIARPRTALSPRWVRRGVSHWRQRWPESSLP